MKSDSNKSVSVLYRAIVVVCALLWLLIVNVVLTMCSPVHAQSIPTSAHQYRATLTREAHAVWGLEAPVLVFAGQLHQESNWRADARSIYADGLAQFTRDTAQDMAQWYPDLGPANAFSPNWAIRAMVRYDARLFGQVWGASECDVWWATLRAYNGGLGHWRVEARQAANPDDRISVDAMCGVGKRSSKHCPESLGYPRKILLQHAPRYQPWGGVNPCL